MASLYDVERIFIGWNGICHVVASEQSGFVHTLCGTLASGESITEWPLKARVCRKCRRALKAAKVVVIQEPTHA